MPETERGASTAPGDNGGPAPDDATNLARLRSLLVGPDQERLRRLEERLNDPSRQAEAVGRVLPEAVAIRSARDDRLSGALAPLMDDAIRTAVRRDPQPLADAIFPIIGPAIRKAMTSALAGLVQSLNQTLEHTFSLQGLRWRWEAIRTGTSFGEVVLRHSLVYRVEQIFLIYRESGLVLQHVTAESAGAQAPEMVAGMLTAIQDFARDSFQMDQGETLETMQVGELSVWLEQGPHAILAAVIRGQAPVSYRTELQKVLETIHQRHAADLAEFAGDASPFARSRPLLEECLRAEVKAGPRRRAWRAWALATIGVALLAFWLIPRARDYRRWNAFVERLRQEPGIVVTETDIRDGKLFVRGLRDPAARDPAGILAQSGRAADAMTADWQPYLALEPGFVAERARTTLGAPASVRFSFSNGALYGVGTAPLDWVVRAEGTARLLPGVTDIRWDSLRTNGPPALDSLRSRIESLRFFFATGSDRILPADAPAVASAARLMRGAERIAETYGLRTRVTITGETDSTGGPEINAVLAPARAERVLAALVAAGVPRESLTASGAPAGPDAPSGPERRRVTFRLELLGENRP